MNIVIGQKIEAKNHAELLNKVVGASYKAWMRCVYRINEETDIFFIRLNGKKSAQHWTNTLINENCFVEKYIGSENEKLESHKYTNFPKKRATFDIVENNGTRVYIFRGIFEYSKESDPGKKHVWYKIADELHCKKQ